MCLGSQRYSPQAVVAAHWPCCAHSLEVPQEGECLAAQLLSALWMLPHVMLGLYPTWHIMRDGPRLGHMR